MSACALGAAEYGSTGTSDGTCSASARRLREIDEDDEDITSTLKLVASGVGLVADSYDLFAIDLVIVILELHYGSDLMGAGQKSLLVGAMLAGVIVGQVTFGRLTDTIGRGSASLATASLTILGALLCSIAGWRSPSQLVVQLSAARFLLGVGVGGEYPVTAAIACEASQGAQRRGKSMTAMISMQGWGMMLSSSLVLLLVAHGYSLDTSWRLLLAFGALPSTCAFLLRLQLHRVLDHPLRKVSEGLSPPALVFGSRQVFFLLLGTGGSWFLMNFALYSMGSFKSSILKDMIGEASNPVTQLRTMAQFGMLTSFFALGGFWTALAVIGSTGRFGLQAFGFVGLAGTFTLMALIAGGGVHLGLGVVVALFCQMFFFLNCGPNTTTYIVASESFPVHLRGTCHGLSAACGKCGAFLGAALLAPLAAAHGLGAVYAVCAGMAVLGVLVTLAFTPRRPGPASGKQLVTATI